MAKGTASRLGPALILGMAGVLAIAAASFATLRGAGAPATLEERTHKVAAGLRCPVCRNLSVADSPSPLAQEMRRAIRQRLRDGQSQEQIRAYFVDRYGEWILLSPRAGGLGLLPWAAPALVLAVGGVLVVAMLRRRSPEVPISVGEDERARIKRDLDLVEEGD